MSSNPPADPFEEQLFEGYSDEEIAEIRQLMAEWEAGKRSTVARSIVYHGNKHGEGSYLKYLRKAHNFKRKGAKRIPAFGTREDDSVRWERKNGEFLVERNGKVVSYGRNTD